MDDNGDVRAEHGVRDERDVRDVRDDVRDVRDDVRDVRDDVRDDVLHAISAPGRVAEPSEGISEEELALATRNHGLPLEALRYDVTPPGLHYVLTHYDIPAMDAESWRLTIDGRVRTPRTFDLPALRSYPAVTRRVTMECAGNGRARLTPRPVSQPWLVEAVGTADWTGVPLRTLLAETGPTPDALEAVFTGADHGIERGVEQDYQRSLPLGECEDGNGEGEGEGAAAGAGAGAGNVLVAYEMNGAPIPPQHGHPVRLVVPGWYGMAHVKWLRGITLTDTPFTGFQQSVAYVYRQSPGDEGTPVTRIAPRSLMIPPGFPDFMSRTRVVRPGPLRLEGRAWSGRAPVTRVEVSPDDGDTWYEAELTPQQSRTGDPWSWRHWRADWTATPGAYVLTTRATDATDTTQPTTQPWNRGGFANNLVQRVPVHCVPKAD